MLLNLKITLTLLVLSIIGVSLSQAIWTEAWQVPTWYKLIVGGICLVFLISLVSLMMVMIWSL